jgi:hypothetical protein
MTGAHRHESAPLARPVGIGKALRHVARALAAGTLPAPPEPAEAFGPTRQDISPRALRRRQRKERARQSEDRP